MKADGHLAGFFARPVAAVLGLANLLVWGWVLVSALRRPATVASGAAPPP
jgi:hypothetical protein